MTTGREPSGTRFRRPQILLIQDGPEDDSGPVRTWLQDAGFRVTHVPSAVQAARWLHDRPLPAAAVVDLRYSAVAVESLVEQLRAEPRWRPLPLVLLCDPEDGSARPVPLSQGVAMVDRARGEEALVAAVQRVAGIGAGPGPADERHG
jgi:CheY-like chemotaxis protein